MNYICLLLPLVLSVPPPLDIQPSFRDNYRMGLSTPEPVAVENSHTISQTSEIGRTVVSEQSPTLNTAVLGVVATLGVVGIALVAYRFKYSKSQQVEEQV